MRYIFTIFGFVLFLNTTAQDKVRITGKLVDDQTDIPLEFATVTLLDPSDSALVAGDVTNVEGKFSIEAEQGTYLVKMQFIAYEAKYSQINADDNINLGTVSLSQDVETLSEVVVQGQRGQMQLELDKRVFNVAENLNNIGADASQILDNLPSISVDVDGNVSLRGSQNVRILINGKPSGLVGLSGTDALRQLQGNLIERIEVVTNPSARYDAEGSAGIINIVLKKARQEGFNGAVTLNTGWPHDHGISVNANYRKKWYNLFMNYGLSYDEGPGGGNSFQRFTFPDTTYMTRRHRDMNRTDWSNTIRLGSEFFLNEKNSLTASFLTRIADEENFTTILYEDISAQNNLINHTGRRDLENEEDNNYEAELNYRRTYEEEGHELSAAFQYRINDETESSFIEERDLLNEGELIRTQRSVNEQGNINGMLQADYVKPLGEGKKFEAGYRGNFQQINSDYVVQELNQFGQWEEDEDFTNEFFYDELVNAAYMIFENKMDRWGYQLGLRVEHTNIDIFQPELNITNNKNYINPFPSAFLSYKITDQNSVQASYSRRLSRPRFWYLNPFFSISDIRNIRTGNIDLDPEYTDSYEIGYLRNMDNASLYFGTFYRHTTNVIERVNYVEQSDDPNIGSITYSIPQNLSVENSYGLEMNFSLDPVNWISINGNANFYRAVTEGRFGEIELNRDTYTASFRLNSRFTIGKYSAQLSGRYNAPEESTQGTRKAMYTADLGVNRDVLQNKGTLTLSVRDLFNSRLYRGTSEGAFWYEESEFQWRQRQVNLSFTYRINQQKKRQDGRGRDGFEGGEDMDF